MLTIAYVKITYLISAMSYRVMQRLKDWWRGGWIQTRSGARWYPHDPRADEVHIEDLGACAWINRFGGHAGLCSVIEHQIRVFELLRQIRCAALVQLQGLMHDTPEVYPPHDIARPVFVGSIIHRLMAWSIRRMKRRAERAVFDRLGLPGELFDEVRWADLVLLHTEARDRMPGGIRGDWGPLPKPLRHRIERMQSEFAEWRWWCLVEKTALEAASQSGLTPTQVSKLRDLASVAGAQREKLRAVV